MHAQIVHACPQMVINNLGDQYDHMLDIFEDMTKFFLLVFYRTGGGVNLPPPITMVLDWNPIKIDLTRFGGGSTLFSHPMRI